MLLNWKLKICAQIGTIRRFNKDRLHITERKIINTASMQVEFETLNTLHNEIRITMKNCRKRNRTLNGNSSDQEARSHRLSIQGKNREEKERAKRPPMRPLAGETAKRREVERKEEEPATAARPNAKQELRSGSSCHHRPEGRASLSPDTWSHRRMT